MLNSLLLQDTAVSSTRFAGYNVVRTFLGPLSPVKGGAWLLGLGGSQLAQAKPVSACEQLNGMGAGGHAMGAGGHAMDVALGACHGPRIFLGYWQGKKVWEHKVPRRSSVANTEAMAFALHTLVKQH